MFFLRTTTSTGPSCLSVGARVHYLYSCCLHLRKCSTTATHTVSCPPAPSNMEIGLWLPLDKEGKKEDLWAEAYACCLQRMAEASIGHSWETEGEGMVPQVSPLVQAFLTAMGRSVSPSLVREFWPSKNDIIPRQIRPR